MKHPHGPNVYDWIDPFDEIEGYQWRLCDLQDTFAHRMNEQREQHMLETAHLRAHNAKLIEALTDRVQMQINPPIMLMERPVLLSGLIVLPIKGSAL